MNALAEKVNKLKVQGPVVLADYQAIADRQHQSSLLTGSPSLATGSPSDSHAESLADFQWQERGDLLVGDTQVRIKQRKAFSPSARVASTNYDYRPLSLGEFRVIEILPSKSDIIECSIQHHSLTQPPSQTHQPYEALSYTWGDHEKTETIRVDNKLLPVTWSLYHALYHLRNSHTRLWVDAICINQNDLKERGHQVREMSKIYARADNVVVWLGAATKETEHLMNGLASLQDYLAPFVTKNLTEIYLKFSWDVLKQMKGVRTDSREEILIQTFGIKDILARPWFTRVWIIQEVAFAKSLTVYCGSSSITGKTLSFAPTSLGVKVGLQRQAILDIMASGDKQHLWWSKPRDLLSLLKRFHRCTASEPRDRVYALLGLCSDDDVLEDMDPDYASSDLDVVRKVIYHLFGISESSEAVLRGYPTISRLLENIEDLELMAINHYKSKLNSRPLNEVFEIAASMERGGVQAMRFLLRSVETRSLSITPDTVLHAVSDPFNGATMTRLLFEVRNREIQMNQELICAAVRNRDQATEIVRLLISYRPAEIRITADVVQATAENKKFGKAVMLLLLKHCDEFVDLDEKVISLIVLSFDRNMVLFLHEKGGKHLKITSDIIKVTSRDYSAQRRLVELLMLIYDARGGLEDEVVGAVFRYIDFTTASYLLSKLGTKSEVTESQVMKILDNLHPRERASELLFWRYGIQYRCSPFRLDSKIAGAAFALTILHSKWAEMASILKQLNPILVVTRPFIEALVCIKDAPGSWEDTEERLQYVIRKTKYVMSFSQDDVNELWRSDSSMDRQRERTAQYMQWALDLRTERFAQEKKSISRSMNRLLVRAAPLAPLVTAAKW